MLDKNKDFLCRVKINHASGSRSCFHSWYPGLHGSKHPLVWNPSTSCIIVSSLGPPLLKVQLHEIFCLCFLHVSNLNDAKTVCLMGFSFCFQIWSVIQTFMHSTYSQHTFCVLSFYALYQPSKKHHKFCTFSVYVSLILHIFCICTNALRIFSVDAKFHSMFLAKMPNWIPIFSMHIFIQQFLKGYFILLQNFEYGWTLGHKTNQPGTTSYNALTGHSAYSDDKQNDI